MLHFNGPIVRPPQEDYRQFIEVTVGCTHNSCKFCNFYAVPPFSAYIRCAVIIGGYLPIHTSDPE